MKLNCFKSVIAMLIVLVLTACGNPAEANYETDLFDTGYVHTIDVRIAESDWQDLLTHSEEKTKYDAAIVIDGESVEQVSFAAKGNFRMASMWIFSVRPKATDSRICSWVNPMPI